jgi:hypothetical protein
LVVGARTFVQAGWVAFGDRLVLLLGQAIEAKTGRGQVDACLVIEGLLRASVARSNRHGRAGLKLAARDVHAPVESARGERRPETKKLWLLLLPLLPVPLCLGRTACKTEGKGSGGDGNNGRVPRSCIAGFFVGAANIHQLIGDPGCMMQSVLPGSEVHCRKNWRKTPARFYLIGAFALQWLQIGQQMACIRTIKRGICITHGICAFARGRM